MLGGSGMQILLAQRPDALLERLVADLAAARDPWARQWLVLPGGGRGEWVQRRWAETSGIASRSQLLSVRALVELAAAGGESRAPFDRDALALRIAAALPRHAARLPLAPGLDRAQPAVDGRRLAWARELADAIDMELLCRRGNERYVRCRGLGGLAADPTVAPALDSHLGALDEAGFARRCDQWMRGWTTRGGLPRLWLQLDVGLPTVLMDRLCQLLAVLPAGTARCYALSPSLAYWGDLRAGRRTRPSDDEELVAGPVLGPFGRRAQDLHVQLIDGFLGEGTGEETIAASEPGDHLLGRLQDSCHAAGQAAEPVAPIAAEDDSFSVHACRSPLRELEVCRDRILQAMTADPTLRPDEVLLLLADATSYAPLVAAAFQPGTEREDHLPLRLVGEAGTAPSVIAEGLGAILAAVTARCDQEQLLGVIEQPAVARRFGFDRLASEGVDLLGWLQQACFRWGLDPAHRAALQGGDEDRWCLAFALRRLALGAIVDPAQRDGLVGDAAPLDRAGGLAIQGLARLAQLAELLVAVRAEWVDAPPAPAATWCTRVARLVEHGLAPVDRVQAQQRDALLLGVLPALERRASDDALLTADGFQRLLAPGLDELAARVGGGGAGVRVAALGDHAGTPARMVLVCGLGEQRFPRRDQRAPWHPLAGGRRRGDPDRRDDDRHHLLLALLAARERLVLSYEGGSTEDPQPRPPSTPLADLIAAAERLRGGELPALVHHHPLHGHAPSAHAADTPAIARSHAAAEAAGAQALQRDPPVAPSGLWSSLLPAEAGLRPVPRRELRGLLVEPCRLLLDRIGLRLREEDSAPRAGDRFALDGLEAWRGRDRLLRTRLEGGDESALRRRFERAGELPPGCYGERAWLALAAETPRWDDGPLAPFPEPPDLLLGTDGDGWLVTAAPERSWWVDRDGGCHRFDPGRLKRGAVHELPLLLDLLLQVASHGDGVISGLTCHFAEGKTLHFDPPPAETARALLSRLLALRDLARRLPLPWWRACHEPITRATEAGAQQQRAAGLEAWRRDASGARAPCELAATRLCFRSLDDPFAWNGPSGLPLPAPELPLALRCHAELAAWQLAANAACRAETVA